MQFRPCSPLLALALGLTVGEAAADPEPHASLAEAIAQGQLELVRTQLHGQDVDQVLPNAMTPLHAAVYHQQSKLVSWLLEEGANPNRTNRYGVTPVMLACTNGDHDALRLLLGHGAQITKASSHGETPLMLASRTGNPDCVQSLLDHGADPNRIETWGQQTALMWAAAEGQREATRVLLRAKAEIHRESKVGLTAFQYAARQGKMEIIQVFLEEAFPSHVLDDQLDFALSLAVRNAHYQLAALLLNAGGDPNAFYRGHNLLHAITWTRRPGQGTNSPAPAGSGNLKGLEFVRLLLEHGIDIDARMTERRAGVRTVMNFEGATAFLLAARTADLKLMRLLLELGADPTIPNTSGTTPLLAAAGVGVQSPGEDPGTAQEVYEAVKIALDAGCDINKVNERGETAMHGAAYKFAATTIPLLADHGADIAVWNTKNQLGWTPLRIAVGVHRGMNLRRSPESAEALRKLMIAAGVSVDVEPETNISGATR